MQRVDCMVRLGGDLGNTVQKKDVTAAEVAVLRAIHGSDAVFEIKPRRNDKTPHSNERGRLMAIYGDKIVNRLFPGQFARLPVNLKELEDVAPVSVDDGEQSEGRNGNGAAVITQV